MKHLSRPTILGFGHPSGALEDGARGKFFYCVLTCSWDLNQMLHRNQSKCYIQIKAKINIWHWYSRFFDCKTASNFGVEGKSVGTILQCMYCIIASKFGVEGKSDGTILLYESLQFWSWRKKCWKVYPSTLIDNLRSQPAFGRLRNIVQSRQHL